MITSPAAWPLSCSRRSRRCWRRALERLRQHASSRQGFRSPRCADATCPAMGRRGVADTSRRGRRHHPGLPAARHSAGAAARAAAAGGAMRYGTMSRGCRRCRPRRVCGGGYPWTGGNGSKSERDSAVVLEGAGRATPPRIFSATRTGRGGRGRMRATTFTADQRSARQRTGGPCGQRMHRGGVRRCREGFARNREAFSTSRRASLARAAQMVLASHRQKAWEALHGGTARH